MAGHFSKCLCVNLTLPKVCVTFRKCEKSVRIMRKYERSPIDRYFILVAYISHASGGRTIRRFPVASRHHRPRRRRGRGITSKTSTSGRSMRRRHKVRRVLQHMRPPLLFVRDDVVVSSEMRRPSHSFPSRPPPTANEDDAHRRGEAGVGGGRGGGKTVGRGGWY